jgi:uncharacterized membrane protein YkoI
MTQKFAYIVAAGMAAFMIVLLGALGAYIVLHGQDGKAASAEAASVTAPVESTAPNGAGSGDLGTSSDSGQSSGGTTYPISAEQAGNIALSNAPGASLLQEPQLVKLQGTAAYEVLLDRGQVFVDATSGQVLYDGTTTGRQRRGFRR